MRTLIVEDDVVSRFTLQKLLSRYGRTDVTVNGIEAVEAFTAALEEDDPYDAIMLDIMMPEMDGQQALKEIRKIESERDVPPGRETKIVMVTALDTPRDVIESFYRGGCSSYVVKPIERRKIYETLRDIGLPID
ncbi:MAG: response regulator [Ignavibacteriales bacterium]|nr:response regulator [Ignavibacteriales bacterium]